MNHLNENLSLLVGHELNILLSDGNSIEGVLASIKDDYLVIETDKYFIYHNLKNVKGFLKNTKKLKSKYFTDLSDEAHTLTDVLRQLQTKWVSIDSKVNQNSDDNQSNKGFSGFLSTVEDEYVILIGKEVQMYLNTAHINNIILEKEDTNSNSNSADDSSSSYGAYTYTGRDSIFGGGRK